ncbi:MAG: ABC transporter ATP-binding protein [Bacteroidales bacterium]|nr:ABC transporter ATP-binding protein [Bacteroidales bacterium]
MIEAERIVAGYGSPVAGPLDFSYPDGSCMMVTGRNGSGKTTLMKTLAGQIPPLSGSFRSGGPVVMVPTRIPKVKGFSVREFILTGLGQGYGPFRKPGPEVLAAEENAVRLLGLHDIESKDLGRISDGEFQKACTAIALVRRANVILLDEPTAFLDVENRKMVLSVLRDISRSTGATVLFSTHDIHDGALYSDGNLEL